MKNKYLDLYKKALENSYGKEISLVVSGDSMYPCLKDGDKIRAIVVQKNDIINGDIIIYKKFNKHLTIHRVVKIISQGGEPLQYITKGDNNKEIDSYVVLPDEVIGKVVK